MDPIMARRQKIERLKNSPMAQKMIFADGNMVTPIDENHPKFGIAGMIGHITETTETPDGIEYTVRWNDDFYNPATIMESEIRLYDCRVDFVDDLPASSLPAPSLESYLKQYEKGGWHGD